jgi:hypothetical protein
MRPKLKPPGAKRLKLMSDVPLSTSAFRFNLRRYNMAEYLGVTVKREPDLMWIAKQAVQCALPPNWVEAEDEQGNAFFHNTSSGQSQAKHPMAGAYTRPLSAQLERILWDRGACRDCLGGD